MKAVMLSVRPQWCELIANGQKTVEVRKSRPKIPTPFKCYIYCTQGDMLASVNGIVQHINQVDIDLTKPYIVRPLNGKVIGEFVCDDIREAYWDYEVSCGGDCWGDNLEALDGCCLTDDEIFTYLGRGKTGSGFGWHISALKVYDKPRELSEFKQCDKCPYGDRARCDEYEFSCDGTYALKRAPQSWCYIG